MRFNEFRITLAEAQERFPKGMDWGNFNKKGRAEDNRATFIRKIKAGEPFTLNDRQVFAVDNTPDNINAIQNWQGGGAPALTGRFQGETKPESVTVNRFAKTSDFAGQFPDLAKGEEGGKEAMQGRTAHLDLHSISKEEEKAIGDMKKLVAERGIKGSDLTPKIINSPVLQQADPHGTWIIEIAKNIAAKQYPVPVNEGVFQEKKFHTFIQDYAGEYLGVAALVNGLGNFPNLGAFLKFLGADNLQDLLYYFPQGENTPLADSFGFIKTPTGEHEMKISSKGGKKGASPSMSNLKIPDDLEITDANKNAVEFIKIIQENSQVVGTLKALNMVQRLYPKSIAEFEISKYLPIRDDEIAWIDENVTLEMKDIEAVNVKDFPKRLQPYAQMRQDSGSVTVNTGDFIMACTRAVLDAINKNNAFPDFEKTAIEILGYNFVQIFTVINKSKKALTCNVLWPAKVDGKVSLYSNSSQNGMNGRIGFSVLPS